MPTSYKGNDNFFANLSSTAIGKALGYTVDYTKNFFTCAFCSTLEVINFIPSIPQAIELIAGIGGTISLFSSLYQGFRKSSSKIDDKEK